VYLNHCQALYTNGDATLDAFDCFVSVLINIMRRLMTTTQRFIMAKIMVSYSFLICFSLFVDKVESTGVAASDTTLFDFKS
jgi:hypothetical protein